MSNSKLNGNCHCGGVTFTIPFNGEFYKIRRCNCSMCARRGAIVASVKVAELKINDDSTLSKYEWGTKTSKNFFCSRCGIYVFHQRRSDPTEYAINIACLEGIKIEDYKDAPILNGRDSHPSDTDGIYRTV